MAKYKFRVSSLVENHSTPATIQFEHYYRQRRVLPGWRNKRVQRLCSMLDCNYYELCAMACEFDFKAVSGWAKADRWPASLSLHFALIEASVFSQLYPKFPYVKTPLLRPEFLRLTHGKQIRARKIRSDQRKAAANLRENGDGEASGDFGQGDKGGV